MATAQGTLTFTPRSKGKLVVSIDYDAQGASGGDWGSSYTGKVFMTQNSSTSYGNTQKYSTTRSHFAGQYVFDVAANQQVDCGLEISCTGATAINVFDLTIRAHLTVAG